MPLDKLFPEPLVQISCGQSHSLFLTRSGRVFGAGEVHVNQLGPLCVNNTGIATELFKDTPTKNFVFSYVTCGYNFSFFHGVDGVLYCTGANQQGQLVIFFKKFDSKSIKG
jgi:alpha-tubulin suppressor-like RCC1 family protein